MSLSIQRVHDFTKAHEISDERQVLAMACLIRVCERADDDVTQFIDVTHVNTTWIRIERESPAHGSVCLRLRSQSAYNVLVIERRDDKRVIRKTRFLDYPINLGLAGKVGNVEPAAADCIHIW